MSALPPPGTRYAVYARYSTGHQTFKSIEDQLTLCRAYAERQDWIEAGAYHDAERSGTTVIGRSGLFDMLAAADRGEFQVILVEDLDRLSRSASGTHGMLEEMEALDALKKIDDVKAHTLQLCEQNMEQAISILRGWIKDSEGASVGRAA